MSFGYEAAAAAGSCSTAATASAEGSGRTVSGGRLPNGTSVMSHSFSGMAWWHVADCIFCDIRDGKVAAHIVDQDESTVAFLDQRPLFPGHVLVIPRAHHETLMDLPAELVEPLFIAAQRMSLAVKAAMHADGVFVAANNLVSQSVPHLH